MHTASPLPIPRGRGTGVHMPRTPSPPRTVRLVVRLSRGELLLLQGRAIEQGTNVSEYIRRLIRRLRPSSRVHKSEQSPTPFT